jgi:hypothetical protein
MGCRVAGFAAAKAIAFEQRNPGASFSEQVGGCDTRNATTDNRHIDFQIATQRQKFGNVSSFSPIRVCIHGLRLIGHFANRSSIDRAVLGR